VPLKLARTKSLFCSPLFSFGDFFFFFLANQWVFCIMVPFLIMMYGFELKLEFINVFLDKV
jgi:hypothetical protein